MRRGILPLRGMAVNLRQVRIHLIDEFPTLRSQCLWYWHITHLAPLILDLLYCK